MGSEEEVPELRGFRVRVDLRALGAIAQCIREREKERERTHHNQKQREERKRNNVCMNM